MRGSRRHKPLTDRAETWRAPLRARHLLRGPPRTHPPHCPRPTQAAPHRRPPSSPFESGGALPELVLLGVLAIRKKDQRLEWDSKNLRFTNNDQANELLKIHYREGWTL